MSETHSPFHLPIDKGQPGAFPPGTRFCGNGLPNRRTINGSGANVRILLTFTGFHDPYSKGLVGEEEQPGPIVSLLQARSFDLVYLLSTPNTERNTAATVAALKGRVELREVALPLQDPIDPRNRTMQSSFAFSVRHVVPPCRL